jgi:hypothetical protein
LALKPAGANGLMSLVDASNVALMNINNLGAMTFTPQPMAAHGTPGMSFTYEKTADWQQFLLSVTMKSTTTGTNTWQSYGARYLCYHAGTGTENGTQGITGSAYGIGCENNGLVAEGITLLVNAPDQWVDSGVNIVGRFTTLKGLAIQANGPAGSSSATITNWYGVYIQDPTTAYSKVNVTTLKYGLYIDAMAGATTNTSLYIAASNSITNLGINSQSKVWVMAGGSQEADYPTWSKVNALSVGVTTTDNFQGTNYGVDLGETVTLASAATQGGYVGVSGLLVTTNYDMFNGTGGSFQVQKKSTRTQTTATGGVFSVYMVNGTGGVTTAIGGDFYLVGFTPASSGTITTGYGGKFRAANVNGAFVTNFSAIYCPDSSAAVTTTYNAILSDAGNCIFNEGGGNYDFRIEGDTDANLFFLDASVDRVGIGMNNPAYKLDVNGSINIPAASAYYVNGAAGVSGSFTTVDLKTVTVTKGIITSIS